MQQLRSLMVIIKPEDDGFVALGPSLNIASQGGTFEEARANLVEALTPFFEVAEPAEVERRLHQPPVVLQVEVPVG